MKVFDIFKNKEVEALKAQVIEASRQFQEAEKQIQELKKSPTAYGTTLFTVSYNGEKNFGEIGPIKDYKMDHDGLRYRSWQAYAESELAQTVIGRYITWIIGTGLKLQAEPNKVVLKSEKVEVETEDFNEIVEARFTVHSNSEMSDYSEMGNLHILACDALKNAILGGDVLVVNRYINGEVKAQLIDGAHVVSPILTSDFHTQAKVRGNQIRHGIEIAPNGKHVAYYVRTGLFNWERIEAIGSKSGLKMAYMVYGLKYRLDNVRGVPLLAVILETLKKLERYKEAVVGSAEERQKIAYSIVHEIFSDGESPLAKNILKAYNADAVDDMPTDSEGNQLANTIAATTNKQVFNMPKGSKLQSLESKNELYFAEFYDKNIDILCAAIQIPPDVAMSKYDSNFSASRAALKDWENTIHVNRRYFSFQFYRPYYDLWLHTEILKSKVQAVGYLGGNRMVLAAYRNARWVGSSVPHIDPLKEVSAERLKLGNLADGIPLTTVEAATENLNSGDSDSNMAQFSAEFEEAKRLKLIQKQQPVNP